MITTTRYFKKFAFFEKLRKNKEGKLFCPKPFRFFEVDEEGYVFLCCPDLLPLNIGNLKKNTLMEVWNSESAQKIRKSILDGTFSYCIEQNCGLLQSGKLPKIKSIKKPFLRDIISKEITFLETGPKVLNLGYDRTCNISCPSCRCEVLSLAGEGLQKAKNIHESILGKHLKDVERLIVTGHGDPFASSLYRNLLQNLDSGRYPQLRITIMTNGLLLTPAMWRSLHKIHGAIDHVYVSIDAATEETYKFNRRGGDFNKLLKNLEFIGNLRRNGFIKMFRISFVVQQNNYKEMKMFIELGKRFNCNYIIFSKIRNWGTYTEKEFSEIAVHERSHSEHKDFLWILKDPLFKDSTVLLDDLNFLVQ